MPFCWPRAEFWRLWGCALALALIVAGAILHLDRAGAVRPARRHNPPSPAGFSLEPPS